MTAILAGVYWFSMRSMFHFVELLGERGSVWKVVASILGAVWYCGFLLCGAPFALLAVAILA